MGTLFATENVKLAEEGFGLLYLYLKDTTVDFHQNTEYDLSITFDGLSNNDIRGLANALLSYLDGDDSIE